MYWGRLWPGNVFLEPRTGTDYTTRGYNSKYYIPLPASFIDWYFPPKYSWNSPFLLIFRRLFSFFLSSIIIVFKIFIFPPSPRSAKKTLKRYRARILLAIAIFKSGAPLYRTLHNRHKPEKFLTKIYDKRNDLNFPIVKFPDTKSNIPNRVVFNVYISQLLRFLRVCSEIDDFKTDTKMLISCFLSKGCNRQLLVKKTIQTLKKQSKTFNKFNISPTEISNQIF